MSQKFKTYCIVGNFCTAIDILRDCKCIRSLGERGN